LELGTLNPVVTAVECIIVATGCLAAEREATAAAEYAAVTQFHAIHIVSPTGFDSSTGQTRSLYAWLRSRRSLIEARERRRFHPCADFVPHMEINPSDSDPFSWTVVRSTSTPIVASRRRYAWPYSLP
jgi:hypothetical protein